MTKRFIQAFISLKYIFYLPPISILIFIFAMIYFHTKMAVLKLIVAILAIILLIVMGFYYSEKFSISYKLSKFKNVKEYDDAYIIGQAFLLDNRMLVYQKRKLVEIIYSDIIKISATDGKKGYCFLDIQTSILQTRIKTTSKAQAERFVAFVLTKCSKVELQNISANGDGILAHIETGKGSF